MSEQTAAEAASFREDLMARGVPADHPGVLIDASARENGGTFETAKKHFWKDEVQAALPVAT